MLIHDVKKIEELRKQLVEKPEYQKKIEKMEKKLLAIHQVGNGVQSIYVDKYKSKVAVMENGDIFQFEGPRVNPHILGILIAMLVLTVLGAFTMTLDIGLPPRISEAIASAVTVSVILLNVSNLVFQKEMLKKQKWLFGIVVIAILWNIYNLFF